MINVYASLILSVFNIYAEQSLKVIVGEKTGTAVLIDPELVLTAAHVIETDKNDPKYNIYVRCFNDKIKSSIVKKNDHYDLALLRLDRICNNVPITKLAIENPSFGEDVYSVHCPDGMCGILSQGIVSGFLDPQKNRSAWMLSDIQIFFGSSGAPLFNYQGDLVGICSRIKNFTKVISKKKKTMDVVTTSFSIWIPIKEIRIFLENK